MSSSPSSKSPKPAETSIQKPETEIQSPATTSNSYGQILRSSSIIGGATGINYVIGMVRTKVVAVLLGPSGVGLVGLYVSITGLVSTIAQLGIDQSGVREVAEANGSKDPDRVARVVRTLRRACWFTGVLGWVLTAVLAWPLSQWTFGSPERMGAVAILGVTVLVGAVAGGQAALLQGMRRIGDLARIQVLSAVLNTIIAIVLYSWLREKGIVPVIISTALIQLGVSWHFSRRIQLTHISQSWRESAIQSRRLIGLGAAFMYGGLLAAIVGVTIRSLIIRDLGLEANGIYQAAWGISGMFAGFVLGAMGTDFYPRLTAVADDNKQVNQLVNEQIEIGILLAVPGLLATLVFAPFLMHLFYSARFLQGAELLPWLTVGVFGQVLSYPLGFVQRAKGKSRWILISQTHLNLLLVILTITLVKVYGLQAAAWAFAAATYIHGFVVLLIARHLSGFSLSGQTRKLMLTAILLIISAFLIQTATSGWILLSSGIIVTFAGCIYTVRMISTRLDPAHRILQIISRIPLIKTICGV